MKVIEFNTEKGLYIFEFDNFETGFHSHPTVEIVLAKKGSFTLNSGTEEYQNVKFAIIAANQKHKLSSTGCELKVIMIEHHTRLVNEQLSSARIVLKNGYYIQTTHHEKHLISDNIIKLIKNGEFVTEYDPRIADIVNYLNHNDVEYNLMVKTLQSIANLSESRLSHLFKSNIGISLKKYLIWTKLKSTINQHLNSKDDLVTSLIKSGFYDQPHFSRSFKTMLGVKPSKAYNSRNLQV